MEKEKTKRMSALSVGERGMVKELMMPGGIRRRLLDLGLTEGAVVKCIGRSPLGDPSAYLIRGKLVAIRRRDADGVNLV